MMMLHGALLKLLQTFFDNFLSDFRGQEITSNLQSRWAHHNNDILQFSFSALYKLPVAWMNMYVGTSRLIQTTTDLPSVSCEQVF